MNTSLPRSVLLVAPVMDELLNRLTESFQVYRLYEQNNPAAFLQEFGSQIQTVVTRGDVGVSNSIIEMLPELGLIAIFGVGTDAVDLSMTRSHEIAVTVTSGVLTNDVADLAMGLLLAGARKLVQGHTFVCEGRWLSNAPGLATQVSGKRIGILGMGNIGQAIARRASGFDMEILYTDRQPNHKLDYQWCPDVHTLAHESDFLVLAASGSKENQGMIDASVFNVMPDHAWLINIARGILVNENDLIAALQEGKIAGAGLDVYADEPHVPDELIALENVILQPHVASATFETRKKMSDIVFDNVSAWFNQVPLPNKID